jgi:protein-L-isoaspartate(D-aspartate) O-methyltransferase
MIIQQDSYQHKGLREKLIQTIRDKGIRDEAVLQAMRNVPRHFFLDPAFDKIAYEDRAFPIGEKQTISQPYTVAYQTELLGVKKFDKVLEIGTGSAYQATVLAELGAKVYSIERQKKLFDQVQKSYPFKGKYPNLKFFFGDGYKGLPIYAGFQAILVTAAAPFIPEELKEQLLEGGRLVIPVGSEGTQVMMRLTKQVDGVFIEEKFDTFSFVPMLEGREL